MTKRSCWSMWQKRCARRSSAAYQTFGKKVLVAFAVIPVKTESRTPNCLSPLTKGETKRGSIPRRATIACLPGQTVDDVANFAPAA